MVRVTVVGGNGKVIYLQNSDVKKFLGDYCPRFVFRKLLKLEIFI